MLRYVLGNALVVCLAVVLATATARAAGDPGGTLVVRLVIDPTPAGVNWSYTGAGAAFQLGDGAREQTVSLPVGTYQLTEAPAQPGQAKTLTALACTDPSGDTHATLATASASIALADGETVTCTFTHRALGGRSAAATLALARTYAPILRLSSGERYRPLRIEDYLARSSLMSGSPPKGSLLQSRPTLFSLPTTPGASYLDVRGADPASSPSGYATLERQIESADPQPTVYWHVARAPGHGRLAIEYWLLYLYNDFYDRHEADWEGITVFLQDNAPLGVSFTTHQGRRWSAWAGQPRTGTHPLVAVARGSHANYPRPGRYRIRVCATLYGQRRCFLSPTPDTATGSGAVLGPSSYSLQEFGGVPFSGNWSSGTYIRGYGRTSDKVGDPRRRSDYSYPFAAVP